MIEKKRILLIFLLLISLFLVVGHVSAADFNVHKNTSLDDIHNWMNNTAKNGDRLIFNGPSYRLNDTLVITKSIVIGSRQNTILFFDDNKTMIDIRTNAVNITGLSMIHRTYSNPWEDDFYSSLLDTKRWKYLSTISTSTRENSYINFNMRNSRISTAFIGIDFNMRGNIKNSSIKSEFFVCINSPRWIGHLSDSKLNGHGGVSVNYMSPVRWRGNIVRSNITLRRSAIDADYYNGTIFKSRLRTVQSIFIDERWPTLRVKSGKFMIYRSIVRPYRYTPVVIGNKKQLKIVKSSIMTAKGYPKFGSYKSPPLFVN
ncbi:MAG: hypothetical protein FWH29_02170 [Methanobrevibacter sp.]|nr:hypothetical protein [Methanobrevibacter sp.]